MASVNTSLARLLNLKLSFLESQRDHLQSFCQDVTQVLKDAATLVSRTDASDSSLHEMNRKVEEMTLLLASKHIGAPSDSKEMPSSSQEKTSDEWKAPVSRQCQSSPTTEISTISHGEMVKILSRLDVIEVAVSSLRSTTEKTSEIQTEIQNTMGEIKNTQTDNEERETKKFADMEKKLKKMGKKSEDVKEQGKRVSALEKEVESLKLQEKRVASLESDMKTMKKQEGRVARLEYQIEKMASQSCDLEKRILTKMGKLDKQMETNNDLVYHLKSRVESLSNRTDTTDTAVQDLSHRMDENKQKLEDLDVKTKNLTKRVNRNHKKMEEKFDNVKTEYKMVCQMVADRLLPLERLRRILNQKVKTRDENLEKLNDTADKVTDLMKQVSDLEKKKSTLVGFTARYDRSPLPRAFETITGFTDIISNCGNHFDSSTGMFIAPVDGLYAVSLTLWQVGDGDVAVCVIHELANPGEDEMEVCCVCYVKTVGKNTSSTGFLMRQMKSGDSLYVRVYWKKGNAKLSHWSSFSCVLIA